jgi:PAS domain S-box-containing protein
MDLTACACAMSCAALPPESRSDGAQLGRPASTVSLGRRLLMPRGSAAWAFVLLMGVALPCTGATASVGAPDESIVGDASRAVSSDDGALRDKVSQETSSAGAAHDELETPRRATSMTTAEQQSTNRRLNRRDRHLDQVTLYLKFEHQFQFAGYYAAIAQGYYEEAGLEVTLELHEDHACAVDLVLEKEGRYAIGLTEPLERYLEGDPLVALAPVFQHCGLVLIARRDSGIQSPQDMVGKRVVWGKEAHHNLRAVFMNEGVDPETVHLLPRVDTQTSLDGLVDGSFDVISGYSTNEPFLLRQRGIEPVIIQPRLYEVDLYGDTLFTSQRELSRHSKRAERFLRASLRGWAYAFAHESEMIDLIQSEYASGKSRVHLEFEAREMRKLVLPDLVELGHTNPARWENNAEMLVRLGIVPEMRPLHDFLYYSDSHRYALQAWLPALLFGLAVALVSLLTLLAFNRRLKRVVAKRTADLRDANARLLREIEERRQAQEALHVSESRYRAIHENAALGIFESTLEGKPLRVNAALVRLFGYDSEAQFFAEVTNAARDLFVHPEDRGRLTHRARGGVGVETGEILFRQRAGSEFLGLLRMQTVCDSDGEAQYFFGFVEDITERRRAEERIRFQAQLLEAVGQGVIATDLDRRITYWNRAATEIYGWSASEAMGRDIAKLLAVEGQEDKVHKVVESALAGRIWTDEFQTRLKGGGEIPALVTNSPVRDAEGKVVGIVGVSTNIAARKATEGALRRSEREKAAILSSMQELVAYFDTDRNLVWANDVALEAAGVTDADSYQLPCYRMWKGREEPCPVAKTLNSGEPAETETVTRDGRVFSLRAYAVRDEEGTIIGAVEIGNDITERRRAEEAARQSEKQLALALSAVNDGVWDYRLDTGATTRNDRWYEISGYARGELEDHEREHGSILHAEDREMMEAALQDHLEGKTPQYRAEFRLRHKSGAWRWVLGRGSVVERAPDGTPLRIVGTDTDVSARKEVEEALREREATLQSIFRVAPIGIGLVENRVFRWVNERMCEMLGYTPQELLGESSRVIYPSDEDFERVGKDKYRQMAREGTGVVETRFCTKDGKTLEILLSSTALDPNAPEKGVTFTALDITAAKRAEADLRDSEALLQSILRAAPVGIGLLRGNLFKWINQHALEMTGYDHAELVEQDVRKLYPSEAEFEAVRQRGGDGSGMLEEVAVQTRWRHQNGRLMDILLQHAPIDPRNPDAGMVHAALDITERCEAEAALRESEQRFQLLADNLPQVFWISSPDWAELYYVSPAYEDIWQESCASVYARPLAWLDAVHEEDRERVLSLMDDGKRPIDAGGLAVEFRIVRPDGRERWISARGVPVFDETGTLYRITGIAADVTEQRRVTEELARHRTHLQELVEQRTAELELSHQQLRRSERLAALGTMAAGVAHEINNPLGGMALAADAVLDHIQEPAQAGDYVDQIKRHLKRCARIVEGMLHFAQDRESLKSILDFNDVLGNTVELSRTYANQHSVVLEYEPASEELAVLGNDTELEQVGVNLVHNAVHACSNGGCVRLRVERQGSRLLFTVSDDGDGMTQEEVDHAFEPFFTTRLGKGGTGLGLSTVHGIISDHGGSIELHSEPGRGTTVVVRLPLQTQVAASTRGTGISP